MTPNKTLQQFLPLLEQWEAALANYSEEALHTQPAPGQWSIGQVYVHLIQSTTKFHLQEAVKCATSSSGAGGRKNFRGFLCYQVLGGFPPVKITVPPSPEYTPAPSESIAEIRIGLALCREEMTKVARQLTDHDASGKTTHPGFGPLSAREWFRLVPMHWKHHFRQQKRLDVYLADCG